MAEYKLDAMHSEITFKVRHLMISTVTGSFNTFDAKIVTEGEGFTNADISFEAQVGSIDTGNEQRDGHLKSPDFFDAEKYPTLSFVSTEFVPVVDNEYKLLGNLTIKGTTQPVSLTVEYGGTVNDPYGQTKAGFEISGKIKRSEFGLTWSATTETGNIVVSDEVKLVLSVQFIKQA